jgi:serine/threonine protein kinase
MKAPSFFSARRRTPGQRPAEGLPSEAPAVEPYKPLFEIGRGGMGVVTLALARGPERFAKLVVLKRLHEHLLTDPASVQMLLDEARISARLAHPNVVQVHEATLHRGAPTIVMEYLEGLALPELMGQEAPLPLPLHLAVLIQVLRGLDAAHELVDYDGKPLQLVHRDMSPHNVFVGYDGVVKVLDFGIAKVIGSDEGATRTGVLKGKLRYMSPEQIAGGELDRRCDLFSVGVMLGQAAIGRSRTSIPARLDVDVNPHDRVQTNKQRLWRSGRLVLAQSGLVPQSFSLDVNEALADMDREARVSPARHTLRARYMLLGR